MNLSAAKKSKKMVVVGHDATRTGAPIFLLHLVSWFRQNSGYEIEILLRNSGPLAEEFGKIAPTRVLHYNRLEMALHRTCQMFGWQTPHWISSAAKLARYLRRSSADLVYANTVAVADEVTAVAPLGLPILWHVHEMPFVINAYDGGKPFRAASGFAKKFIAVSESVKLGLVENGVPADKIQVIHGFVPPGKKTEINIPASRAQVRAELNLPPDAFVAGMCGTVGWRKGFDWFIAVARQLAAVSPRRDIHLIWIGAPEDETVLSQVNYDLQNARLTERVKFIGARTDSRPYLAALDAFLLSSREDSFPLVMLEAASLGLPVVCFAGTGGATEFVGDDAGIVVDNGDVLAAAAALVRLADQPALRQQLGAAGREKVRTGFNLEAQGPKILRVVEELTNTQSRSRQSKSLSGPIIKVENLSKRYLIGHQKVKGEGLRHAIEGFVRSPQLWFKRDQSALEEFWALKDISFEIQRGDVVGVIGRNGAGKSTLLKILSRITEPTTGRVEIEGRVASLLEVGTGFHAELTGRENIYLNGAILGMSRSEITRKFDEIVAFAEVEKFLDTPVKRYSSGMYVRLAFAVAAHLEPEILIVDEVLAVGDAAFQKKCLGKMREVSKNEGRTVLFVSHNIASVQLLCNRGLLLKQGAVQKSGSSAEVIESYLREGVEYGGEWTRKKTPPADAGIYLQSLRVMNEAGEVTGNLGCTKPFSIEIRVQVTQVYADAQIALRLTNSEGVPVMTTCNTDGHGGFIPLAIGEHTFRVEFPANFLVPTTYTLQLAALRPGHILFDIVDNTVAICLEETGSVAAITRDLRLGVVNPIMEWKQR